MNNDIIFVAMGLNTMVILVNPDAATLASWQRCAEVFDLTPNIEAK